MALTTAALNSAAGHLGGLFAYIGLVNASGTELSGGSPAYARKAATFGTPSGGSASLTANLTFDIPVGATVAGWRGFSAATSGTEYGGGDLASNPFPEGGQYILLASSTKITVANPV